MNIMYLINELLDYGLSKKILNEQDFSYCANVLIDKFHINQFQRINTIPRFVDDILNDLAIYAYEIGIINSNDVVTLDNFKAKVIDVIIDKPSVVINKFYDLYKINPNNATDFLYQLSKDTNYIQTKRIAQNQHWTYETEYGKIELTINLSKPEKDPKLIALQKEQKTGYPLCQLCKENEGYRGHIGYDARSNMRIIPLTLNDEKWFFQYSPYSYFNEHSIVLNEKHIPMIINKNTFIKLIEFLDYFPEYFVGSNAGLPIVGGSILNHEHYQSGKYHFPIEIAKSEVINTWEDVEVYKVIWPLSTIRLKSTNKEQLISLANQILLSWQKYQNEELNLYNDENNIHHTVTPIARKENKKYVFDIILRSNYTNNQFPDGVFHPHPNLHHIKKENIGLIEAMGLAILPPRLKMELTLIENYLLGNEEIYKDPSLKKHLHWVDEIKKNYNSKVNVKEFILEEVAKEFSKVLQDSGVFKMNSKEQNIFLNFINNSIKK